jgi:ankyrin repeat protein
MAIPLFQFYIDLGLDISSTNKNGDTVLHLLCKEYNFEDEYRIKIIKSMLAIGARSDVKNKLDKKPIDLMPKKFRERWSSI